MKIIYFSLIFLFLISPWTIAAGVTAAATFEVTNVLPVVELELYEDEGFDNARTGFNNGEQGWLRIGVYDGNGVDDIKSVEARFVGVQEGGEIVINDYSGAEFVNGLAGRAVYRYAFDVNTSYDSYRIYAKVTDGGDETITSVDFSNVQENVGVTGAAVARPGREEVIEFFRNLFNRVASWF